MQGRPGLMLGAIYRTHVALAVVVDAEKESGGCVGFEVVVLIYDSCCREEGLPAVLCFCVLDKRLVWGCFWGSRGRRGPSVGFWGNLQATKGGSSAQTGTKSEGVWRSISLPIRHLTVRDSSFEVGLGSYLEFVSMHNLHLAILANGFNEDGGWYLGWTESDV
ncbi:hypothetical protein U1Q18_030613 [Sarracenia purpurea var. burkii]